MLDIFFKDIRVMVKKKKKKKKKLTTTTTKKKPIKISSFILILSYNCVFQFWITKNDLTKQNNEEM